MKYINLDFINQNSLGRIEIYTKTLNLIKNIDVLNFYVKKLNIRKKYDYLSLLLPTCPFRNYKHIKLGVKKLFDNKNVDVVLSASETNFPIQFALKKRGDFISPFFNNSPLTKNKTRSQNQPKTYFPNGGFWMSKTKTFLRNKINMILNFSLDK